ncbi:MAG: hypothetical protein ACK5EA_25765 [Planctomycetaceae bacterium]
MIHLSGVRWLSRGAGRVLLSLVVLAGGLGWGVSTSVVACPFCASPSLTLAEQLAKSDAGVLVQWVDAEKPTKESIGSTTYAIVEIARQPGKTSEASLKNWKFGM